LIQKEKNIFRARELSLYYEINNAIHLKIAEKSENYVLFHYIKELLQKTTIFLILFDPFYQLVEINNTSPAEHQKIVQLLEDRNGKQAGLAMENHLASAVSGIDVNRLLPNDYLTV
jgi:DNA-binding GntR family transcriptional regulator